MTIFLNRQKAHRGFPVGSILPWTASVSQIPKGWLPCNGSTSVRVVDYPLLYRVIGNIYGGTANVNFRLPRLNDGTSAAMDMFKGHFYYLRDKGDAHKPEKTNITDDIFWQTVGGALTGNAPSTTQTSYVSTVDIVGVLTNQDPVTGGQLQLSALYSDFELIQGEFTQVVLPSSRKLGDKHIPSHGHGYEVQEGDVTNYTYSTGVRARDYAGGSLADNFFCDLDSESACIQRAIPLGINGEQMSAMTGSGAGPDGLAVNWPSADIRWGGGSFGVCPGGETGSICYDPTQGADGFTGGDMWAHRGGQKYYWSSLSKNAETNDNRRFVNVSGHGHQVMQYTFSSKYIRVLNPALVSDVRLNNVDIINTTGLNFGTITANTATPNLTMTYIIKAF